MTVKPYRLSIRLRLDRDGFGKPLAECLVFCVTLLDLAVTIFNIG